MRLVGSSSPCFAFFVGLWFSDESHSALHRTGLAIYKVFIYYCSEMLLLRDFVASCLCLFALSLYKSYASLAQLTNALTAVSISGDNVLEAAPIAFPKRATIHTAIAQGAPGYPDWKIRYIKVASLMPLHQAAEAMVKMYNGILRQLPDIDLDAELAQSIGTPFEMSTGGSHLNFYAPLGKLTKAFIIEIVEELLESTKMGWVTQFKSEWKDMVSGFTVYITLAWGNAMGPKGIAPGPIDRL